MMKKLSILFLIVLLTSCKSREVNKTLKKESIQTENKSEEKIDSSSIENINRIVDIKIIEKNSKINIKPINKEPLKFKFKVDGKEYEGETNGEILIEDDKKEETQKSNERVKKKIKVDKKQKKKDFCDYNLTEKEKQQKVEYIEAQWYAIFILFIIAVYKLIIHLKSKYLGKWQK